MTDDGINRESSRFKFLVVQPTLGTRPDLNIRNPGRVYLGNNPRSPRERHRDVATVPFTGRWNFIRRR